MRRRHEREQRKSANKKYALTQERLERVHSNEGEDEKGCNRLRQQPLESSASNNSSNTRRELADDPTKARELEVNAEMNGPSGSNTSEQH